MDLLKDLSTPILVVTVLICRAIKVRFDHIFQEDMDGFDGEITGRERHDLGIVKRFLDTK